MKPWMIVGSAVVVGLAIGGGVLGARMIAGSQEAKPHEVTQSEPTPTPEVALKDWTDPAGFVLSYPETLTLNKHEEDEVNYAHLEFIDPVHKGTVVVWAKDLPKGVTDVDSWVKKEPSFAGASVIDTTLGGQPAKKVMVTTPTKRVVVGTIYDDLLWYIDLTPTDEAYWTSVGETMTSKFSFQSTSQAGGTSTPSSGDSEAVDEEEVLQ